MKFTTVTIALLATTSASAFVSTATTRNAATVSTTTSTTRLFISSIGLGPSKEDEQQRMELANEYVWVEGVDYEIPNHEEYRLSRRSQLDEKVDAWFEKLLATDEQVGVLGKIAVDMKERLLTPVELVNDVRDWFVCFCVLFHLHQSLSYQLTHPRTLHHLTTTATTYYWIGRLHTLRYYQTSLDTVGARLWIGAIWNSHASTKRRSVEAF
jgi:hypothetical protein